MTRAPRLLCVATAVLALTLSGCSSDSRLSSLSSSFDLRLDDPIGFVACRDLVNASEGASDERDALLEAVAAAAAQAESAPIRRTVSPSVEDAERERISAERGLYTVDTEALLAACRELGFDTRLPDGG